MKHREQYTGETWERSRQPVALPRRVLLFSCYARTSEDGFEGLTQIAVAFEHRGLFLFQPMQKEKLGVRAVVRHGTQTQVAFDLDDLRTVSLNCSGNPLLVLL
jgi:hypothetical protein